ncbi:hypothetical protein MTR_0048s0010 [Medicago truncatula]|uniref:DUF7745 domain-containing protein n=1 Tax=Medicago truncatula TaxID=3880 RepID=A0A072TIL2_MEDTR|nr:hypothetical protein MTR_0048s0010 [Medicago truncatula]
MLKNPGHFQDRYGNLLNILKTKVDVMLLNTLVQFYDPIYHGFTFPDFQLFPTLEEYSHWVGLPVLDEVPFHAFGPIPRIPTIAKALHLEVADIKDKFTPKDGLPCLPYNFLHQKATTCFEKSKTEDFESILALLIYGIVLFPSPEPIPWSQKLMTWTPRDIDWFNPACDPEFIIDSCGDINNVPLGTRGGISYSPILARQHLGYYMEMNPVYLILDRDFFLYKKMIRIKECSSRKPANKLKMPYPRQRIVTSTVLAIPLPSPPESLEGYQKQLDIERREKSMWEMKYRKKEQEYDTLKNLLDQQFRANHQEKEENIRLRAALQEKEDFLDKVCPGRKKRRMDLFDGPHSDFED